MVHKPNETEGESLSLRRRVRRFWIEEKRLARIVRSVLFHVFIALPLDALLKWLGVPAFAAMFVAANVEVVSLKSNAKDKDN